MLIIQASKLGANQILRTYYCLIAISLFLLQSTAFADELSGAQYTLEKQKIAFLLNKIQTSNAIFIRNEEEHSAAEAVKHLSSKLEKARKKFYYFGPEVQVSAKIFIEKVASKSSLSGKPYHIKLPSGKKQSAEQWLKSELQNFKK